jgi:hypothetical protein
MPLDSDIANADAHLNVEFYEFDREPYVGQTFVRIRTPGDQLNVYDQPAREDHKMRFPQQWLAYQVVKQGGDVSSFGTPLNAWHEDAPDEVSRGQLTELGILGFHTVEQVARASDAQVQRIGMGGAGLRERARAYLANKNRSETDQRLEASNAEIVALKSQMAALMERLGGDVDKRGPGRPRKVTEDVLDAAAVGDPGHG